MKKLEILIPQYKEDESVVCKLLNSIAMQQGINLKKDVGIIIVNDGTDVILSDDFLKGYDLDITYLKNEKNMGISFTRNKALDAATADYVMFCDDDDMFYDSLAIHTIFERINEMDEFGRLGFDVFVPLFKEEILDENGRVKYITHKNDITFNHGKVYNRFYLISNNIRFSTEVTFHEDVYFNALALTCSERIVRADDCYYLWCNNMNSTTRSNPDFLVDNVEIQVKCYSKLIDEFLKRNMLSNAKANAASGLYKMYYESQTGKYLRRPDRLEVLEKCTKEFYLKYKKLYEICSEEQKIKILKAMKCDYLELGILFEKITFEDWIKKIEALR